MGIPRCNITPELPSSISYRGFVSILATMFANIIFIAVVICTVAAQLILVIIYSDTNGQRERESLDFFCLHGRIAETQSAIEVENHSQTTFLYIYTVCTEHYGLFYLM